MVRLSTLFRSPLSDNVVVRLQAGLIIIVPLIPLFFKFPFKENLFLAWEGAYRLYLGQIPFKDFGLPTGFIFWIIPAIFFKIFGPYLFTLIKAQALINLISLISLRSILHLLQVRQIYIFFTLLVFSLSYVLINFWPWYNHTVFVLELLGLNFILLGIFRDKYKELFFFLGAFLTVSSFFTKQDGGGFALLLSLIIMIYFVWSERRSHFLWYYLICLILSFGLYILPFLSYDFTYWFNYGQPPHHSRLDLSDILEDVFRHSQWIKFYLFAITLILLVKARDSREYFKDKHRILRTVITVFILLQALVIQTTSYIPHNVNAYFHSFAFAYIISAIPYRRFKPNNSLSFILVCVMIGFWWSGDYWKYGKRILKRHFSLYDSQDFEVVSKKTWKLEKAGKLDRLKWKLSEYKTFKNVYLPEETVRGIDMLDTIFNNTEIETVLNMTELTPLAHEFKFEPGTNQPLWYHQNVAIFDREISLFCARIKKEEFDLVLFQTIPELNNFFPSEIRDCLQKSYKMRFKFLAPRKSRDSFVEVYTRGD